MARSEARPDAVAGQLVSVQQKTAWTNRKYLLADPVLRPADANAAPDASVRRLLLVPSSCQGAGPCRSRDNLQLFRVSPTLRLPPREGEQGKVPLPGQFVVLMGLIGYIGKSAASQLARKNRVVRRRRDKHVPATAHGLYQALSRGSFVQLAAQAKNRDIERVVGGS